MMGNPASTAAGAPPRRQRASRTKAAAVVETSRTHAKAAAGAAAARPSRSRNRPRDDGEVDDTHNARMLDAESEESEMEEEEEEEEAEEEEEEAGGRGSGKDGGEDSDGDDDDDDDDADTPDLYEFFGVAREASNEEIKKAYRKMCLKFHPDKLMHLSSEEERRAATQQFQELARRHAVLADPARRKLYDETGYAGDDPTAAGLGGPDLDAFRPAGGWDAHFRAMWDGLVTADAIDRFAAEYRGSAAERDDVLAAYRRGKGDMDVVLEGVPLCEWDDEDRFRALVADALAAGVEPTAATGSRPQPPLKRFARFFEKDPAATERRRLRAEREAKLAEKAAAAAEKKKKAKKGAGGSVDELAAAMQLRRAGGNPLADLVARLEARETAKASGRGRASGAKAGKREAGAGASAAAAPPMPTDEEFEAIQQRIVARGRAGGAKGGGNSRTRAGAGEDDEGWTSDGGGSDEGEGDGADNDDEDMDADDEVPSRARGRRAGKAPSAAPLASPAKRRRRR